MRLFIGPGLAVAVQLVSIATLAAPVDVSGVIDQILPEDTSKAVGLVTLTNPNVAAITISKFVPTLPNVVLPDSTDNVTHLFIVAGGSCPAIPFVLGPGKGNSCTEMLAITSMPTDTIAENMDTGSGFVSANFVQQPGNEVGGTIFEVTVTDPGVKIAEPTSLAALAGGILALALAQRRWRVCPLAHR